MRWRTKGYTCTTSEEEIANGNPAWTRDWAEAGGDERAAADDLCIAHHRDVLIRAIRGSSRRVAVSTASG